MEADMTSRNFPGHASIPAASVGVGFKPEHAEDILAAPKLENRLLELGPVIAGGNRFEHGLS